MGTQSTWGVEISEFFISFLVAETNNNNHQNV